MPFKRLFKDKYAGSSPENASVVRTLFDLFVDLAHSEIRRREDNSLSKRGKKVAIDKIISFVAL